MERDVDEITGQIVDAAYKLHTGLGPGLLESVYEIENYKPSPSAAPRLRVNQLRG